MITEDLLTTTLRILGLSPGSSFLKTPTNGDRDFTLHHCPHDPSTARLDLRNDRVVRIQNPADPNVLCSGSRGLPVPDKRSRGLVRSRGEGRPRTRSNECSVGDTYTDGQTHRPSSQTSLRTYREGSSRRLPGHALRTPGHPNTTQVGFRENTGTDVGPETPGERGKGSEGRGVQRRGVPQLPRDQEKGPQ